MKYGFFIFHLLLLGWFTNLLYNLREEGKNKASLMHYFILLVIPTLLVAETMIPCSSGTQRASK